MKNLYILVFVCILLLVSYAMCARKPGKDLTINKIQKTRDKKPERNVASRSTRSPQRDKFRKETKPMIIKVYYLYGHKKIETPLALVHVELVKKYEGISIKGPGVLNDLGIWNGKLSIDWSSIPNNNIHLDIQMTVYTCGEYAYVSNNSESYTPKKITEDNYLPRYISPVEVWVVNNKDIKPSSLKFIRSRIPTGTNNNYILVYSVITRLAIETSKIFGIKIRKVTALVNNKFSSAYQGSIFIGNDFSWSPSSIAHEYGHHVQEFIYSSIKKPLPEPSAQELKITHKLCDGDGQSENMAWTEGYATAYSVIMGDILNFNEKGDNSVVRWDNGKNIDQVSIEYYSCRLNKLISDEGRVAAMMYDLYDDGVDSRKEESVVNAMIFQKGNIKSKRDITIEWFGNGDHGDYNSGKRYTAKEVLYSLLTDCKGYPSLKEYIKVLTNEKDDEKKLKAMDIIRYNYGEDLISA